MQNSVVVFGFCVFGKFGPKNQNCQFKLKLGSWNNSNMQNGSVYFFCFILEAPFLVNEGKGRAIIVPATLREQRL